MRHRLALLLTGVFTAGIAHAADPLSSRTPEQVVSHHIAAMLKGDSAALVEDYADEAVIVFATRVLNGKHEIQKMFTAAGSHPAADDEAVIKIASVSGDVVVEEYTHRAPHGGTMSGRDVFVVRHGRIVFHTTQASNAAPAP